MVLFIHQLQHLGSDSAVIGQLLDGSHPFSQRLSAAKRPMIVVGSTVYAQPDLLAQVVQLAQKVPYYNSYSFFFITDVFLVHFVFIIIYFACRVVGDT